MANRFRNERIEIKLTKEEKEIFEKKKGLSKCQNMSHFIRKCVLEKRIFVVDTKEIRKISTLLSNISNNFNQIARGVNYNGSLYKKDLEKIKKDISILEKEIFDIEALIYSTK